MAVFDVGETFYSIQPEEILKNVPANTSAVILAIKPIEHPLLNIGDRSEAAVILSSQYIIE